ncbi:MAG: cyclic nucleotide-binding domain-containing protein [Kofleriaceae bacterium]
MTTARLLEHHPLLARVGPDHQSRIARAGELETFLPGEVVVTEGSLGDALYLVLTGEVEVSKGGHPLARLHAGSFFGEMALIEPAPRSATVTARAESFLFRLPFLELQQLVRHDPRAATALLIEVVKTQSERLRHANSLVSSVGDLADWLAGSLV